MNKKVLTTLGAAIVVLGMIPALIISGLLFMFFVEETENLEAGGFGFGTFCIPEGTTEVGDTPPTTFNLGPVQPHTQIVADYLGPLFGITTIGGYRSDAIDQGGHPAGLALDIMTNNIPNGNAVGDQMAGFIMANHQALSVDYMIWHQRIWLPSTGQWRPMEDRGSISANHYDHIHLNLTPIPTPEFGLDGMQIPICENLSPGTVTAEGWTHPLPSATYLSSRYGEVRNGYTHGGDDLPAARGAPIYAAADGIVVDSHCQYKNGRSPCQIRIDHGGGVQTLYVHMYPSGVHAHRGQHVTAGQHIADVGSNGNSTGDHLHLEVWIDGRTTNPVAFFAARGINLARP